MTAESQQPKVAIVAATLEEAEQLHPAAEMLATLELTHEVCVASMWIDPRGLLRWAEALEPRGTRVILAAAGAEPALAGWLAATTRLPVIAIPTATDVSDAREWLALEINCSPSAPVATVGANGAQAAAMLAARILAVADAGLRAAIDHHRHEAAEELRRQNTELAEQWEYDDADSLQPVGADAGQNVHPPAPDPGLPRDVDGVAVYDLTDMRSEDLNDPAFQFIDDSAPEEPVRIRPADERKRPLRPLSEATPVVPAAREDVDREPRRTATPPARRLGRLRIDNESPDVATIEEVVDCLLEGGVVAFPTETVYGIAADATNPAAVERLFELKGRDPGKAISLMVDSSRLLSAIAQNVTVEVRRLMEAFWPGALTMVFQKRPGNFRHVSPGNTIGVRLPDHSVPLAIMQALARPLACTSANLAGAPEARSADEIERIFGGRIEAILDGGVLPERPPSTVIDVSRDPFRILRLGAITRDQIGAVVGDKLEAE